MECSIDWALGDSPLQRRDLGEWCHCWSHRWHWQLCFIPGLRPFLALLVSFCLPITEQIWGRRFHLWWYLEPQCGFLRLRPSFPHPLLHFLHLPVLVNVLMCVWAFTVSQMCAHFLYVCTAYMHMRMHTHIYTHSYILPPAICLCQ